MKRRLFSRPALLVYGLLLAFLAVSWSRLSTAEMSWHGWIALGLGCVLSLGLAGLLMGLLFHSDRSGADETASDQSVFRRDPEPLPEPERGPESRNGSDSRR